MNFKDLKNKIKEEQKELAQVISRGKYLRKPRRRIDITEKEKKKYFWSSYYSYDKVKDLGSAYRHKHIVYCQMFNNTPYDKIEKPSDENKPSQGLLDEIKKDWESEIDEETLRNCA